LHGSKIRLPGIHIGFKRIVNLNVEDDTEELESDILDDEGIDFSKKFPEPDEKITEQFNYDLSEENEKAVEDTEVGFDTKFSSYEFRPTSKTKKKLRKNKRIKMQKENEQEIEEDLDEELEMGEEMSMKEDEKTTNPKKIVFGSPFKLDDME
jgi:hypothetical protein